MGFFGGGAVGFLPLASFFTNTKHRYNRNRDDKFMQILLNANTMFISPPLKSRLVSHFLFPFLLLFPFISRLFYVFVSLMTFLKSS